MKWVQAFVRRRREGYTYQTEGDVCYWRVVGPQTDPKQPPPYFDLFAIKPFGRQYAARSREGGDDNAAQMQPIERIGDIVIDLDQPRPQVSARVAEVFGALEEYTGQTLQRNDEGNFAWRDPNYTRTRQYNFLTRSLNRRTTDTSDPS